MDKASFDLRFSAEKKAFEHLTGISYPYQATEAYEKLKFLPPNRLTNLLIGGYYMTLARDATPAASTTGAVNLSQDVVRLIGEKQLKGIIKSFSMTEAISWTRSQIKRLSELNLGSWNEETLLAHFSEVAKGHVGPYFRRRFEFMRYVYMRLYHIAEKRSRDKIDGLCLTLIHPDEVTSEWGGAEGYRKRLLGENSDHDKWIFPNDLFGLSALTTDDERSWSFEKPGE